MHALTKSVLAFSAAVLLASPASAQQRGGMFGGPGALLSNKSVQKELKVDDAQAQKLDKLASETREKLQSALQGVAQDERAAKRQELNRTLGADIRKSVVEILKPEQVKRFHQIQLQTAGVSAFMNPELQDKLKLTEDQKTKIQALNKDSRDQMREISQSFQSDREGTMKKMTELRKDLMTKATDLLSSDQKATLKDMMGEPFEVKFEAPAN
jgi:Spy/CpxP family protein refolding chaperone